MPTEPQPTQGEALPLTPVAPGSLSREERRAMRRRIDRARQEVRDLSDGEREWRMSIPARPADDSDLVLTDTINDADRLLDVLELLDRRAEEQARQLETLRTERDRLRAWCEEARPALEQARAILADLRDGHVAEARRQALGDRIREAIRQADAGTPASESAPIPHDQGAVGVPEGTP